VPNWARRSESKWLRIQDSENTDRADAGRMTRAARAWRRKFAALAVIDRSKAKEGEGLCDMKETDSLGLAQRRRLPTTGY
jgi:hypothetical protein